MFFVFLSIDIFIFSILFYLTNSVGDSFKIKKGELLKIDSKVPISAVSVDSEREEYYKTANIGEKFQLNIKAFGIIPVSNVTVEVVDEMHVVVLGNPFGMKIYTNGVLIDDITEVSTASGVKSPAKSAGLKKGDYIISANDKKVYTNEDLSEIVEKSGGKKIKLEVSRNNTKIYINCIPQKSKDTNSYKLGIWIKDSSAGIGTLTFYSPLNDIICGLGHGICEDGTEKLLKLNSGEIVTAEIIAAIEGKVGAPGQLKGSFTNTTLGKIVKNSKCGVYSKSQGNIETKNLTEIALKQNIKNGSAKIYCTVEGDTPKFYDCEIKIKTSNFYNKTQNFVVKITDKELLQKTGGIVQGMSGSPLLQNGKLIGAVTHVLIDDPAKGYGIFAENMLETAQQVAEEQKLKDAS